MSIATFISILFSILIISGIVYLFKVVFHEDIEEPTDYPIAYNLFMSQYTEGHVEGLVLRVINGTKRKGIKFIPRDVDYLKDYDINKNKYMDKPVKPITFWIPKEKVIHSARGENSDHRELIFILPISPEMVNDKIKNNKFGEILMKKAQEDNVLKSDRDFLIKELKKTKSIMNSDFVGELSPEILKSIYELGQEAMNILKNKDDKRFSSTSYSTDN